MANVPTAFVVYLAENDGDVVFLYRCDRVNGNDWQDFETLQALAEELNNDVTDLYNGGEMTLSFVVPDSEGPDCRPLCEEQQKTLSDIFELVKTAEKGFWDENA